MDFFSFFMGMGVGCFFTAYTFINHRQELEHIIWSTSEQALRASVALQESLKDDKQFVDNQILQIDYIGPDNIHMGTLFLEEDTRIYMPTWDEITHEFPDIEFVKVKYYYQNNIWLISFNKENYQWPLPFPNINSESKYKFLNANVDLQTLNQLLGPTKDFYQSINIQQTHSLWFNETLIDAIDNNGELIVLDNEILKL